MYLTLMIAINRYPEFHMNPHHSHGTLTVNPFMSHVTSTIYYTIFYLTNLSLFMAIKLLTWKKFP